MLKVFYRMKLSEMLGAPIMTIASYDHKYELQVASDVRAQKHINKHKEENTSSQTRAKITNTSSGRRIRRITKIHVIITERYSLDGERWGNVV